MQSCYLGTQEQTRKKLLSKVLQSNSVTISDRSLWERCGRKTRLGTEEAASARVYFHPGITGCKMMGLTSPGLLSLKPLPITSFPFLKQQ